MIHKLIAIAYTILSALFLFGILDASKITNEIIVGLIFILFANIHNEKANKK